MNKSRYLIIHLATPNKLWSSKFYLTPVKHFFVVIWPWNLQRCQPLHKIILQLGLFTGLFLFFIGCTTLSKKPALNTKNLSFNIRWQVSSPVKKLGSFSSLIFVQGNHLLRLDILQPFVGVIGSLIVNEKDMLLLSPLKKQYYKGRFNSQVFFPKFRSFPSHWLIAILRAQPFTKWNCQKQNKRLEKCHADFVEIHWKYKNRQLSQIYIKDLAGRQIQAKIQNISSPKLSPQLFQPSLNNWKKQKTPRMFQNK